MNTNASDLIDITYLITLTDPDFAEHKRKYTTQALGNNELDVVLDNAGYLGVHHRHQFETADKTEISVDDFLMLVYTNEKQGSILTKIQMAFREIDKDRSGVITASELDDIFRVNYPVLAT